MLKRLKRSTKEKRIANKEAKILLKKKNIPVTRSTDLLEGPQNRTKFFFPPLANISLFIEQNILIRATPAKVFPVPTSKGIHVKDLEVLA